MANILKYRGQELNSKNWVEGFYVYVTCLNDPSKTKGGRIVRTLTDGIVYEPVKIETVGLISDIEAKNVSKFIAVGDIVKIPDNYDAYGINAGEIYEVVFQFGGFRLKPKHNKKSRGFYVEDQKELELIGNIFDNPELLSV